ncbi:hypothetical protein Tco_1239588, partial [Tanacetum coccineum]
TRGQTIAIAQPWENLKKFLREEYCQDNAIKKFKEEFKNHVMIRADLLQFKEQWKPARVRSFSIAANDARQGMGWLSKLKAKIVFFMKIVQIPLSNGKDLEVHRERPEGNLKQLKTMKVNEPKLKDIHIVREFPSVFPEDLSGLPHLAK